MNLRVLVLVWLLCLLALVSVACETGEILTPAEATARVEQSKEAERRPAESSVTEGPQPGETVYMVGTAFLLNVYNEPDGNRIVANQQRGAEVTILEVERVDDELWYRIKGPGGEGWAPSENISTE